VSTRNALACITSLVLLSFAAQAHHSAAMFDYKKSLTLVGTVKEFQWTNPHCFIQLMVTDQNGTAEWSIEMASPSEVYRSGWRPSTLRIGGKATIVIHPVRNGSHGGLYSSGTTENGVLPGAKGKGVATP
jgi:Family of unknown function (DUF6152)